MNEVEDHLQFDEIQVLEYNDRSLIRRPKYERSESERRMEWSVEHTLNLRLHLARFIKQLYFINRKLVTN